MVFLSLFLCLFVFFCFLKSWKIFGVSRLSEVRWKYLKHEHRLQPWSPKSLMFIIQGKDSKLPVFLLLLFVNVLFLKRKTKLFIFVINIHLKNHLPSYSLFYMVYILFLKFPIRLLYSFFRNKSLHFVLTVANNIKLK